MTQMTVFEGLTQLKLLKSRITEDTARLNLAVVVQGQQVPVGFQNVADFVRKAEASLQSVQDLIKRRSRIKSALVKSNASTEIKVNGVTMTVAEAIELKNSIEFKDELLDKMKKLWYNSKRVAESNNAQVQQQANQHVGAMFGKDNPPDAVTYEQMTKVFLEKNLYKTIAPNNIEAEIEKLEAEINGFRSEVDARLNESNATTLIEVQD